MNKKEVMNKRIADHGEKLIQFFSLQGKEPVKLCKALFRLENKANRAMVSYCNGDVDLEEIDKFEEKLFASLGRIIGKCNLMFVYVNRDPRGYTLKLSEEASTLWTGHKDWGGYGILAPDFRES